ncbi:metal-dependent hydrolase [Sphingomonas lacunae]|uniref:Metal-dependent hydrolase n=1 Tax=Sphingomonas lacunae TaxID=2698828 RepID=A0A6M4ATI9_9SPHN|nr:metal-dependent hydrolase [Sphingomonas lacunae]QJQ31379.1 metal-dependent hydrolase [Sphingomonas lacunae]
MSSLSLSPDASATVSANAFTRTPTPADLSITPRDRRFGRESKQRRWWMNGDPIATAFYNALSVTFPKGEAMFIEAVKAHREGVPEKLAQEIRAFTIQEVMHTREHVAFNRKVEEAGYDLSELNADVDQVMELINSRPPMVNLLATIVLEHYTAIMAADFLKNPVMLEGADQEWGDLWRWHAIEEIEHKGVAYDTWLHATRDWSAWKRWRAKAVMMLLVTSKFWPKRIKGMKALLKQDGLTGWRVTARIWWFMLGNPGIMRKLAGPWLSWFRPSFHPWEHDDRELINLHDSDYAAARMPMAAE